MALIAVDTDRVGQAGRMVADSGNDVLGIAGDVTGALRSLGPAAGSAQVAVVAIEATRTWGRALVEVGGALVGLGNAVQLASGGYREVETTAAHGFRVAP